MSGSREEGHLLWVTIPPPAYLVLISGLGSGKFRKKKKDLPGSHHLCIVRSTRMFFFSL